MTAALQFNHDLFYDRLQVKPYSTNDIEYGLQIRNKRTAIKRRLIQVNPPWLRIYLVFDIDRHGAVAAWVDADLPPPMWTSINPENAHAHSAWALDAPVLVADNARQKPLRYLASIESYMREKLQADPSYSGLITKNPMHPHWRTLLGPASGYDLNYLAEWLPGIEKYIPRKQVEVAGLGRNVDTFDYIRHWAYRAVREYYAPPRSRGVYIAWQNDTIAKCMEFTCSEHNTPLGHKECWHIGRSLALWTWGDGSVPRNSASGKGSKAG